MKSKFELFMSNLYKRVCDWGFKFHYRSGANQWMGSTSPVWKTPNKWIFAVASIADLVLFTVILVL
jgi:hypothetical protein